jgi:hypothetical protein
VERGTATRQTADVPMQAPLTALHLDQEAHPACANYGFQHHQGSVRSEPVPYPAKVVVLPGYRIGKGEGDPRAGCSACQNETSRHLQKTPMTVLANRRCSGTNRAEYVLANSEGFSGAHHDPCRITRRRRHPGTPRCCPECAGGSENDQAPRTSPVDVIVRGKNSPQVAATKPGAK